MRIHRTRILTLRVLLSVELTIIIVPVFHDLRIPRQGALNFSVRSWVNLNSVVANDHTLLTLMDLHDGLLASLFILNDHESLRWPDCIILQVELFTTLTYEHIALAELALGITMIIQELVIRLRMNDMFSLTTLDHT